MRTEQEMFELILTTARQDERIRAVILNGSRANPHAKRDILQDFDIVYIVTELNSFLNDPHWIDRFGKRIILQLPDEMDDPDCKIREHFAYLMQFMDGNRIDLTLICQSAYATQRKDSLSVLLLDKDGGMPAFPPPDENDYLPRPPGARDFFNCCNEFWWVSPYVAKGLWREELPYAKSMLECVLRQQLTKMLTWYIGVQTHFEVNPGKEGKYFKQYLEPEQWSMLEGTYANADYEATWQALLKMAALFRNTASSVAQHFSFEYLYTDDQRVTEYLDYLHSLPK
jgi:aminoglycoside 6-adenylyltransferase